MNWLKDVALLFGEWFLIMLIPLIIGLVIGWLLWYRKLRKVETEKDTTIKELKACRQEKESLIRNTSEEIQSHKLNLVKARKEASDKLALKSKESDQWKADFEECLRDNEALDLSYKDDIAKLKAHIVELEANQQNLSERALKFDDLNTEFLALKVDNDTVKAQSSHETEALTSQLASCKEENQRLAEALINAEKLQDSLEASQDKMAQLQSDLDASNVTIQALEADLAKCSDEKDILISASGEQLSLDMDTPQATPPVMTKEDADVAFSKHLEAASKGMNLDYEDDLKEISGVGPKMEKMLKDFGVQTFYQLSKFDDDGVAALNAKLDGFAGRIQRDNWVGQALELHAKHHKA